MTDSCDHRRPEQPRREQSCSICSRKSTCDTMFLSNPGSALGMGTARMWLPVTAGHVLAREACPSARARAPTRDMNLCVLKPFQLLTQRAHVAVRIRVDAWEEGGRAP